MTTLSHRSLVASARAEIRKLRKPAGMRSDLWRNTQELLSVLAGYLPEVWPTQRTLAIKLGCSQPAIHRRVSTAMRFGLLSSSTHPNPGWMDGMQYHLVCLSEGLKADCSRYASRYGSVSQVVPSSSKKEASPPPSSKEGVHGSAGSGLADEQPREAEVPRWEPESEPEPYGKDPEAPLPVKRVKPVDPGWALAVYFDERWGARANHSRQWRGSRASDRRKAVGYIKSVMLVQIEPDMVRAYIDAFITAVLAGEIELKDEQLPFERFTGWWGRQPVGDPAEEARNRQVLAEMRRRRDERLAALDDDD